MEELKPKRRNSAPRQNNAETAPRRRAAHPRAAVPPAAEGTAAPAAKPPRRRAPRPAQNPAAETAAAAPQQPKAPRPRRNAQPANGQPRAPRPRRKQRLPEHLEMTPAIPMHICPLGGLGEVGKNITLYECQGDMILVDCGLVFPDSDMFGVDLVIPDFTYVLENKDRIKGLFITHGHEDHIGAKIQRAHLCGASDHWPYQE